MLRNRPFSDQDQQSETTGRTSPLSAITAVIMLNGSSLLAQNRERSPAEQGRFHVSII